MGLCFQVEYWWRGEGVGAELSDVSAWVERVEGFDDLRAGFWHGFDSDDLDGLKTWGNIVQFVSERLRIGREVLLPEPKVS
jgi:hypothetical protein